MKILVAIDQSGTWPQIMHALSRRRYPRGTAFEIISVLEPFPFAWTQDNDEGVELMQARKKAAEQILASARERLEEIFPQCNVQTVLPSGNAKEQIIQAIVDWKPNKLIIGTHGVSPNRLFPNSLPRDVARLASCSVELIRLIEPLPACTEERLLSPGLEHLQSVK